MIHSLRRVHWRGMLLLAVLLPVIIVAGILARPKFLKMAPLPEEGRFIAQPMSDQWRSAGLRVRFEKPVKDTERALMCLVPVEGWLEPDVLVYWNPPALNSGLPGEGSVLLGSLKGRQTRCLKVPLNVPESGGSIVLLSLAYQKVLSSAPWRVDFGNGGSR